jgi:DNA-3-methyladenine glycosylase
MSVFPDFLDYPADKVARLLLGCFLVRELDGREVRVRIVETEAYDQDDAASHSCRGETPRTKVMFGESGHLYVYFTYGMHYCCNIVTGPVGRGAAVLIRAVEPLSGVESLQVRRPKAAGVSLTNGPAKLCQALSIDTSLSGIDLRTGALRLDVGRLNSDEKVIQTTRIGISTAQDIPWRFYIADNPYVSKP